MPSHTTPNQHKGFSLFLLVVQFFCELTGIFLYAAYKIFLVVYKTFVPAEPKSIANEIILVTGGADGIGREICCQVGRLENNLTIIIWDVNENLLQKTVKELKGLGVRKVHGFKVDVSNQAEVEAAAKKIREEIGNVTMLFNNAGIVGGVGNAWEIDPKILIKVYEVNAISHCYTLREFLPSMITKNHGHVITTCSGAGYLYAKLSSPYFASKHAIRGYMECVKEDIRHYPGKPNIKFSTVYPAKVATNLLTNFNYHAKKYPFMVKDFTPKFVAEKVIEGVLRDEEHIYVPGELKLLAMSMNLWPADVIRKFSDLADVNFDGN